MNNWGYKMMQFMQGRYGNDALSVFMMIAGFILQIVGRLFRLPYIHWAGLLLFLLMLFRVFSRNIPRRQVENQKFIQIKNRILNWNYFRKQKRQGTYTYSRRERQSNGKRGVVYAYYYCPSCKQQIRIPSGKGNVRVTCPKCKTKFQMHT